MTELVRTKSVSPGVTFCNGNRTITPDTAELLQSSKLRASLVKNIGKNIAEQIDRLDLPDHTVHGFCKHKGTQATLCQQSAATTKGEFTLTEQPNQAGSSLARECPFSPVDFCGKISMFKS